MRCNGSQKTADNENGHFYSIVEVKNAAPNVLIRFFKVLDLQCSILRTIETNIPNALRILLCPSAPEPNRNIGSCMLNLYNI